MKPCEGIEIPWNFVFVCFIVFSGSSVRIDTTLLGFDNMNWQRGRRSYVFKGTGQFLSQILYHMS